MKRPTKAENDVANALTELGHDVLLDLYYAALGRAETLERTDSQFPSLEMRESVDRLRKVAGTVLHPALHRTLTKSALDEMSRKEDQ